MPAEIFIVMLVATGLVVLAAIAWAYRRSRDSFHPMVYLGLMLGFLYCVLPLNLVIKDFRGLTSYLSIEQLEYVQLINLLGVISLCVGIFYGDKGLRWWHYTQQQWVLPPPVNARLKQAAIVCGFIGLLGFAYGILKVGGLAGAYGRNYGGGWSDSGYMREAVLLTLPALLWFMVSHIQQRLSKLDWVMISLLASPLVIQGFLGARRGPTFMIIVALFISWHLVRFRRPQLSKVVVGGAILGLLMLTLVANRGQIYLGSDFNLERAPADVIQAEAGNEYIYGAGVILNANQREEYYWGKRYFTTLFIRPIPKAVWPTKYEDAASMLGIFNLETTVRFGDSFYETLGWAGAPGAYGGIVADVWMEFWWFSLLVLFVIGWIYGVAWRKAVSRGGLWIPAYTLMTSLSVYLVMQTVGEMLFRLLLTVAASWLIWRYGIAKLAKYLQLQAQYAQMMRDRSLRS